MISRCFTVIAGLVRTEPRVLSASALTVPQPPRSGFELQVWGEAKMPK
jgi:hypothetical protein